MIWLTLLALLVVFVTGCFVGAFLVGHDDGYRQAKAARELAIRLGLVDRAYFSAKQRMLDADIQRRYQANRR